MIKTYEAEKLDKLDEIIQANCSIAYSVQAQFNGEKSKDILDKDKRFFSQLFANEDQIDLFPMKDIMVTTCWNKNTDVFTPEETWAARHTPVHKPFNVEHEQTKIIGHMTGTYVIDDDGKLIEEDTEPANLPAKFHIVSTSVIYRKFMDEEYEKQIAAMIEEIKNGKWFVSMEALFSDFDYAVLDKQGKNFVIARDEKSAFLTKYLRAYGGNGEYQGYKLGRLVKNIIFSGKGLVRKPANPESIIFNDSSIFANASYIEISSIMEKSGYTLSSEINTENNNMDNIELLQKQLEEVKSALKEEQSAKAELEKKLREVDVQSIQAKVDSLTLEVKSKDEKVTSLEAAIKSANEAKASLETKLSEVEKGFSATKAELSEIKAKQAKAVRVSTLAKELKLEETAAMELAETLSDLSDEKFAKYVEASKKTVTIVEKKEVATATTVLENAEPNKEVALATNSTDNGVEITRTQIQKFMQVAKDKKTQEK